jgi:hypothetical protein
MDLDALLGAMAATPALPGAKCVGRHDLFDLRDLSDPERPDAEAQALALCRSCPALAGCSAWFESLPHGRRPHGVIAGKVVRARTPASAVS